MPVKIPPVQAGNALDRFILALWPRRGLDRLRARAAARTIARHYEAASGGRRTSNWRRSGADANAANGPSITALRENARDLVRNNSWAQEALRIIENNTVGCGILPKALGQNADRGGQIWRAWAETTDCDADGRLTFYGLQALVMRTVTEAGEVLVRRRSRLPQDGLAIPMQLQVLEPDFIDTSKDGMTGLAGGPIIQGVEFDKIGRRAAYWLFSTHPGSSRPASLTSRRVSADEVLHVFRLDRPGQVRGVSWFAPAIVNLKDFDEYEDAALLRAKIASCFAAFVTDMDGTGSALGETNPQTPIVETLEPGLVSYLKPGQSVEFGNPPVSADEGFSTRTLRRIAAGLGVTYEDLTGDYSQVNFSSGRMGRLKHWQHVQTWRWRTLIPQFCVGVWTWAMETALLTTQIPGVLWTAEPMPMIEPDKEGLAVARQVRAGMKTFSEMVREQGGDPDTHFAEYAADLALLDKLKIWLDSDVRRTSQAGLTQERVGMSGGKEGDGGQAG